MELVTTTASQLNELERLVTNTQKHTRKLEEYNNLAQDYHFRLMRMEQIAGELGSLTSMDPKNLGDINSLIGDLKHKRSELNDLIIEKMKKAKTNEHQQRQSKEREKEIDRSLQKANSLVNRSYKKMHTKDALRNNAQYNGLNLEESIKHRKITNGVLNELTEQNELLMKEAAKKDNDEASKRDFYGYGEGFHAKIEKERQKRSKGRRPKSIGGRHD
jgi:hypothetical protein